VAGFGRLGGGGRGGFPGGGHGAFGSITAIGSNSFTVSSRAGTSETVDVSAATTYTGSSGALAGLSALKTGDDVIVEGTTAGTVVKATSVRVIQPGAGGGFGGRGFGGGGSGS
jgi:preprotein translocase subunit YajC